MPNIPRTIETSLSRWASSPARKVLLLRGPRQIGKTYTVRKFGAGRFKHVLEINFLSDKRIMSLFSGDRDIESITAALAAIYNVPLNDGESLLFLDEIQECPDALETLRFFHEKRPELHVIATGSLLEFALGEMTSFGVGRVDSLFMHPVTFDEYLAAQGNEALISTLAKASCDHPLAKAVHEKFSNLFRDFLFLGGLPEVVSRFLDSKDYHNVQRMIDLLRLGFEDDFAKYRKRVPTARLREVLRSVAAQAGKKFVHSHAYPDASAGQVHQAIELLRMAGLVHKIFHTAANGIPLGGEIDHKKFKAIPFDHGIYQRMIGVTPAELLQDDFNPINKGALAEVYAGCALAAHSPEEGYGDLYYWHREAKSSNAEVDYVVTSDRRVIPIEIKASTKGAMQSMRRFIEEKSTQKKSSARGVRLSMENFGRMDDILIVPLYAISQLSRLLREG